MTSVVPDPAGGGDTFALVRAIMIDERLDEAGGRVQTRLSYDEGALAITTGDLILPLPDGALEAVMKRYGKELAIGEDEMMIGDRLELDEGRSLVRFRFMSRYDVIARDYLALLVPEQAGLCELATSVTAALEHLARSLGRIAPSGQ